MPCPECRFDHRGSAQFRSASDTKRQARFAAATAAAVPGGPSYQFLKKVEYDAFLTKYAGHAVMAISGVTSCPVAP